MNVISPSHTAIKFVPSGAPISTPLWKVDAPVVGATLFPKLQFIFVYPGVGHIKPFGFNFISSELDVSIDTLVD